MFTIPLLLAACLAAADPIPAPAPAPTPVSDTEALRPFNLLIGSWRATGYPRGDLQAQSGPLWTESAAWSWKFEGERACLVATMDKGRHFSAATLEPLPDRKGYRLTLTDPAGVDSVWTGSLAGKALTVTRTDPDSKQEQRLVLTMLHENRYLWRHETRAAGAVEWSKGDLLGVTKEGVPFAVVPKGPECIVSGGVGTSKISYRGKEYFICCSGCRDAFLADPEKYIREAAGK